MSTLLAPASADVGCLPVCGWTISSVLERAADGAELLVDDVLEVLVGGAAEVRLHEREDAVEVVVPRGDDLAVLLARLVEPSAGVGSGPRAPRRGPEHPLHPVQAPVEQRADLLEHLERLHALLVALLRLVLVGPAAVLKPPPERAAEHARQPEPDHEQEDLVAHGGLQASQEFGVAGSPTRSALPTSSP
jgi:hypothetical protein